MYKFIVFLLLFVSTLSPVFCHAEEQYQIDLKKLAIKGNVQSQLELADYYVGHRNLVKAKYWYEKAAKKENKTAEFHLGELETIANNKDRAKYWHKRSIGHGSSMAAYALAQILMDEGKKEEAIKYYEVSGKMGHPFAYETLADLFSIESSGEDYPTILKYYLLQSEIGSASLAALDDFENPIRERGSCGEFSGIDFPEINARAAYKVAELHTIDPRIVRMPDNEYLEWITRIASNGNEYGKLLLADSYLYGIVREKNVKVAHDLFKEISALDDGVENIDDIAFSKSYALFSLGVMIVDAQIEGSKEDAKKYFEQALNNGYYLAGLFLSYLHDTGIYFRKDEKLAISYLENLEKSRGGIPEVQYYLGTKYIYGPEDIVNQYKYSGIKLIKESAGQGYLPARIKLSTLYLNGEVGFMGEKKEVIIRDYLLNIDFLADHIDICDASKYRASLFKHTETLSVPFSLKSHLGKRCEIYKYLLERFQEDDLPLLIKKVNER